MPKRLKLATWQARMVILRHQRLLVLCLELIRDTLVRTASLLRAHTADPTWLGRPQSAFVGAMMGIVATGPEASAEQPKDRASQPQQSGEPDYPQCLLTQREMNLIRIENLIHSTNESGEGCRADECSGDGGE